MPIVAKKSLGQNFLHDINFKTKIRDTVKLSYLDHGDLPLLEIGPGVGDLTEMFLEFQPNLKMVELDADLIPILEQKFPKNKIICDDFMNILPNIERSYLVSNLPYYIGSRLVIDLIAYNQRMPFSFILQKEVVLKTKKTSKITFFGGVLNYFYDIKINFTIPPSAFKPAPKVHSALFTGVPKETNIDGIKAINIFKAMFFKPTKSLFNNLIFGGFERGLVKEIFKKNSWDPNLRVRWENYEYIFETILNS